MTAASPSDEQVSFTVGGEELIAHIPTTNRIGDVENKNLPCLLSYHDDPKRKLKYDIEAVLLSDDDNWVGINQILSNRLVEYFFNEHELDEIVSDFDSVQREVNLGISKLDFRPEGVTLYSVTRSSDL